MKRVDGRHVNRYTVKDLTDNNIASLIHLIDNAARAAPYDAHLNGYAVLLKRIKRAQTDDGRTFDDVLHHRGNKS